MIHDFSKTSFMERIFRRLVLEEVFLFLGKITYEFVMNELFTVNLSKYLKF